MADKERSFWSSLPGLLTGLAGVLTATVALLGLALSQGLIGDGGGAGDDSDRGAEAARIDVDPETLSFKKLPLQDPREATVEVLNDGTGPISLHIEIVGDDVAPFEVVGDDCSVDPLPAGRTCDVTVAFDAGSGEYSATLVISTNEGEESQEVDLEGTSVL